MDQDELRAAFLFQSRACAAFGSPFYARLLATAAERLDSGFRALFAPWEGCSEATLIGHAVALRFVGSLHDIVLEHADAELVAAFPPAAGDGAAAWPAVLGAGRRHSERITRFMAHEPQTNAVRRSACLLAGFLLIDAETGLPLRRLELGASAGRLADDGTGCSPMSTRTAPGSTGPARPSRCSGAAQEARALADAGSDIAAKMNDSALAKKWGRARDANAQLHAASQRSGRGGEPSVLA